MATRIAKLRLGLVNPVARRQPFERQLVARILESFTGRARARRLAVYVIAVPCLLEHAVELLADASNAGS